MDEIEKNNNNFSDNIMEKKIALQTRNNIYLTKKSTRFTNPKKSYICSNCLQTVNQRFKHHNCVIFFF